jgi:hypothetical protein
MFICGPCAVFQERWLNDSTRLPLVLSEQFVAEILGDLPVRSTTSFVAVRRQDPASFTTPKRRCAAVATRRHKVVRKLSRILVRRMSPMPLSGISAVLRASVGRHRSAPGAEPNGVRGIDRLQDRGALLALVGLSIRPTDSLPAAPSSVANLTCFGGHQSNGIFLAGVACQRRARFSRHR